MADKEKDLDELMEHMRQDKAIVNLVRDVAGKYVPISALMLREVMTRIEAATSKEEGERMLTDFFMDVIQGKITPYQ